MNTIDVVRVAHVYSGRPGCMCGCRGTHSYASAFVATNNPGYAPRVSDRSVQTIVRMMNSMSSGQREETPEYVCIDTGTRVYVAYFAKELVGDRPHRAGIQGC